MNTNGQDGVKSRRVKTIVASIIALVVILFVGIWAITGALNSGKKSTNNTKQTETAKTENKKTETSKVSDPNTATSPSGQYTGNTQTETTPVAETAPASNNIPTTGPAEVVFSALMLGVVAALATLNIQLVKQNR